MKKKKLWLTLLATLLLTLPLDAGVLKYRFQVLDSSADPTARIPVFFVCDTEAELPSSGVGEADLAYAKDTDKIWKRTGAAWVEVGVVGVAGSGAINTVPNSATPPSRMMRRR